MWNIKNWSHIKPQEEKSQQIKNLIGHFTFADHHAIKLENDTPPIQQDKQNSYALANLKLHFEIYIGLKRKKWKL